MRDVANDILDKCVLILQTQIFDALRKNQQRIAFSKELAETKRYRDMDAKMLALNASLKVLKEDIKSKDTVLFKLNEIKARQMAYYVDAADEIIKSDVDILKSTLAPYINLLAPFEEIRLAQSGLASQGRLKKIPLPYDEIIDTLKQVAGHIATVGEKLDHVISYAMQTLEKVA